MFFSKALMRPKFRRAVFLGLAVIGITAALFTLSRQTDPREQETPCTILEGFGQPINALAFSPDGKTLATGDGWLGGDEGLGRGRLKLWDVEAGTERVSLRGEYPNAILSLAFSPDGRTLASSCYDGTVRVRDLQLGQDSHVYRSPEACGYRVAFSPDGRILETLGSDKCLRLRDLSTRDEKSIEGVGGPVAFVADDHPLGITRFHNVKICAALKDEKLFTLAVGRYAPWSLVFSPDGRHLAAGAYDGTVTIWDGNTGKEWIRLAGHQDQVNTLIFSPNNCILASGSFHGTVKLWAVATGEELACLHGHTRAVGTLAFAPGGQRIASGSHDQTVRIWRLSNTRRN